MHRGVWEILFPQIFPLQGNPEAAHALTLPSELLHPCRRAGTTSQERPPAGAELRRNASPVGTGPGERETRAPENQSPGHPEHGDSEAEQGDGAGKGAEGPRRAPCAAALQVPPPDPLPAGKSGPLCEPLPSAQVGPRSTNTSLSLVCSGQ